MSTRSFASSVVEPLVCTARSLDWPQRAAYLNDLRTDAPTLIAEVERALCAAELPAPHASVERPGVMALCLRYLRRLAPHTPH
jgi:hypothetical protein